LLRETRVIQSKRITPTGWIVASRQTAGWIVAAFLTEPGKDRPSAPHGLAIAECAYETASSHLGSTRLDRSARTLGTLPPHANLRDDFVHLIASCDPLSVHGLLHSLVVAFLAVAVRSNRGLRAAIIGMLVFHRNTSALPVHGGPLRGAHSTPACPSKTTCLRSQDDPCGRRR
jgi:hypothetical protein